MRKLMMLILMACTATGVMAQEVFDKFLTFSWDVNIPLANTNFIKKSSVKGFQVGYREKIGDHFFVGGDFSNATYDGYSPRQTYYVDGGAITTDFYKYVVTYGATVSGDYYFTPERRLSPFAGLGIGADYNSYKLYYNIYSSSGSGWGFLARPQAGAILKIGKEMSWGVIAAVHYDYSTAMNKDFAYTNFTNLGLRVGIVLGLGLGSPF